MTPIEKKMVVAVVVLLILTAVLVANCSRMLSNCNPAIVTTEKNGKSATTLDCQKPEAR